MSERAADIPWTSFFRLQPASGRSLQVQIRQAIVSAIQERRMPSGARVPASRELADRLGVARNTVVLAYQQLVDEGFLKSRQRSGYFVADVAAGARTAKPRLTEAAAQNLDWERRLDPRPSRDRNIVKPRNWLSYPYPFLYGQFDPSLFPINAWRECARMALSVIEIRDWAGDLIDGDDAELIEQLRLHVLPRRGIWAAPDEIIVTLGAQQALFLLAALLMRPGRVVGVEDPGYPDARNIFRRMGASIVTLAVDEGGLVVSEACAACDAICVTPSSQCPTTVAMRPERRERPDLPGPAMSKRQRSAELEDERADTDRGEQPDLVMERIDQRRGTAAQQVLSQRVNQDLTEHRLAGRPSPSERPQDLRDARKEVRRKRNGTHQTNGPAVLPRGTARAPLQPRIDG